MKVRTGTLIPLKEAAQMLGLGEARVRMYADLELPAIRRQGRLYFDLDDVVALAARRRRKREAAACG